ncbi:MAG: glucosamine-6-phosphate deaminase [Bacteroidales bacterium]|jgi:glucosamine-6-phosphate deaminase|nr:glucosamine-6-phosphate deaminase [Bacteroidales bacterium]
MSKHFTLPYEGGLIDKNLPAGILHTYEKIWTHVYPESRPASYAIADIICDAINAHKDGLFRLGLTTGATPVSLYNELARRYEAGKVSFKNVEVVSIDEYYPSSAGGAQSRNHRLHDGLLDKVDILKENIHIPDGMVPQEKLGEYCAQFDALARNLDLLVIGVGEKGQVGFNEAGANEKTRTRAVRLSYNSRKRQSSNFNMDIMATPDKAITVGIGTMLTAKKIILMAWGEDKAAAVKAISEGPCTTDCPASLLQEHDHISFYVDEAAAEQLTRSVAPWLVGPCDWTPKFIRKAVVWLCQETGKPILKLTEKDYQNYGLSELLETVAKYDKINIDVFNDLQHTITGWPGGKPNSDDSTRPVSAKPFPKTVLIFSPHPDDDVISMGGTFIRLASQGHDVHVAYETSGNVAVHDDVVLQHMDCAYQLGFADKFAEVKKLVESKRPGEPEPRALLEMKGAIRRSEARGAVRSFGLNDNTNAHFLNLPFYESGGIKKNPRTQADVDIIKDLIKKLKPHMIFMAGDLADPHGTHRVCTEAALEAMEQIKEEGGNAWVKDTHVWLYRGAWMEWELGRVDMAVPLSPDEVIMKRHAIFRHLSQKDIVPFPGEDPREFWQRAEERTQNTAKLYDQLGMAEYQAIEVFLKLY